MIPLSPTSLGWPGNEGFINYTLQIRSSPRSEFVVIAFVFENIKLISGPCSIYLAPISRWWVVVGGGCNTGM